MFGIFLNKNTPINSIFLLGVFIFLFFTIYGYFNFSLLQVITFSLIAIYTIYFYRFKTYDNNNFYREFIFLILFICSISHNLTINQLSFLFAFSIFSQYIFLNHFKEINFYYSIGIYCGICLICEPLLAIITFCIFFTLNFSIFNLTRLVNFIFGILTALCLFWCFIYITNDLSVFIFLFNYNRLLEGFGFINIKLLFGDYLIISPIIITLIYISIFYFNKKYTFNDFDIKKTWLILSLISSVFLGTFLSNKKEYFILLNCYPISYLIGNLLTVIKYKNLEEKKYIYIREIILTSILICIFITLLKRELILF